MKSLKQSLSTIVQRDRNYLVFIKIMYIGITFSYFFSLYFGFKYLLTNPNFGTMQPGGGILYSIVNHTLPFISMIPWIILIKCVLYPYSLIEGLSLRAKQIQKLLKNEVSTLSNIDSILMHLIELKNILGKIVTIKKIFGRIFTKETNTEIIKYMTGITKDVILLIKNLQSDFHVGIEKEILEIRGARSLLLKNMNSEKYSHLSKLQSTRLDHQIKQFEELQKVLVKI